MSDAKKYEMLREAAFVARILDVVVPFDDARIGTAVVEPEWTLARWKRKREKAGQPVIRGRGGIADLETASEGETIPAVTFTARIPPEHPLFDKPELIRQAASELVEEFARNLKFRSGIPPRAVYHVDAWVRMPVSR